MTDEETDYESVDPTSLQLISQTYEGEGDHLNL